MKPILLIPELTMSDRLAATRKRSAGYALVLNAWLNKK